MPFLVFILYFATDCSDGAIVVDDDGIETGVFIDSPVEGLSYATPTQAGITDPAGSFLFMPGETVNFTLGDTVLGEALASAMLSPFDLVGLAPATDGPTIRKFLNNRLNR